MADYPSSAVSDPPMGGDLSGLASAAQIVAGVVTDVEVAAANIDGLVGVPSLRTLGVGALQAAAGNDARFTGPPAAHATTHQPGGSDPLAVDAAAGVGSLRTIGTGALQATAGNDARLSDARAPTAHATSHQPGGGDAMAVDAAAATGSLRTLGTGATQAAAGNDARLAETIGEPYCTDRGLIISGNSVVLNHIRGMKYRWPKSGTVTGLAVFCIATGGNVVLGIYDLAATNLNLLATGPSQASGANNTWHAADMTTPLVVVGGDDAYLVVHTDSTTASYGRTAALANNAAQGPLPTGFMTGADGLRMRSWDFNRASFSAPLPNSISVASIVVNAPIVVYVKYA